MRKIVSMLAWGLLIPAVVLAAAVPTRGAILLALALYPIQIVRVYRGLRQRDLQGGDAALYSLACVGMKIPQALGVLSYWWLLLTKKE